MAKNNWRVIGISGATCSGKTTLTESVATLHPGSIIVHQDNYFYCEHSDHHIIIPELKHQNWECLQSVNWNSMMNDIQELLKSNPPNEKALLIVEGHIIYNYPDLEKLFDKKYFITLNEEECFTRRNKRVYDPPDCPKYFELCIWPMYLSNLNEIQNKCDSVLYVDGMKSGAEILKIVTKDLLK